METATVTFNWSTGARSGTFCASGVVAYWADNPQAESTHWAHALKRADERWILVVAFAPSERGDVNRIALLLPSRRFGITGQSGLWRGPYNLDCASSDDPAADDCWGLEELSYCLSSADPEEQAELPDCLAGWPRGMAIIHRVGHLAVEGPSDEAYGFEAGVVTLEREVTAAGQQLTGTFDGTMIELGQNLATTLVLTEGRFRLTVQNAPFFFSSVLW